MSSVLKGDKYTVLCLYSVFGKKKKKGHVAAQKKKGNKYRQ